MDEDRDLEIEVEVEPDDECPRWARELRESLDSLHRKVDLIMTTEADLQALAEGIATSVAAAATEFTTLEGQIAALTAGQPVSQEQLDAINASFTSSKDALSAAVATAQVPPAPPAGGTEPPAPPSAPNQPVYQHLTADAIDGAQWPASGFETAPTDGSAALPLYYSAADVVGGSPNGAVEGVWQPYTGAVQAVPAQ